MALFDFLAMIANILLWNDITLTKMGELDDILMILIIYVLQASQSCMITVHTHKYLSPVQDQSLLTRMSALQD